MDNQLIIYPALVMFFMTMALLLTLGISRFIAIQKRHVSIKYYRTYTDGSQPERLHIWARHVQNHFEIPPLFYAAVILIFVTESVSMINLIAAWSFVILRLFHSLIHLGSNNVSKRFFCFGLSLLAVTVMWISLTVRLLATS